MKILKYILFFLFVVFCITDCKKYPDNKGIHLRTVNNRLSGGWLAKSKFWVFTQGNYLNKSYVINGVGSSSGITLYKNGTSIGAISYYPNLTSVISWYFNGTWQLVENDNKLIFTDKGVNSEYTIMKLDYNDLWFQNDSILFKFQHHE